MSMPQPKTDYRLRGVDDRIMVCTNQLQMLSFCATRLTGLHASGEITEEELELLRGTIERRRAPFLKQIKEQAELLRQIACESSPTS